MKLPEKKSKFLRNVPGKIEILLTRIHDPHISNQIDAAADMCLFDDFPALVPSPVLLWSIFPICVNLMLQVRWID